MVFSSIFITFGRTKKGWIVDLYRFDLQLFKKFVKIFHKVVGIQG